MAARAPMRRPPIAVTEALGLAVRSLAELPLGATLELAVHGVDAPVYWTTSRTRAAALLEAGDVVFTPIEFEAAALGAENDRAWPPDMRAWCARKNADPSWRLGEQEALCGLGPVRHPKGQGWTFGELLYRLGATLVGVDLERGEVEP